MKLSFDEYQLWISQEMEKLVRPTSARGRKLVDDSIRALDEARGFFEDLSRKGDRDMASKRDPVSYRAARLVGHSARGASQSLTKIQPPQDISWDSLKAFKDSLSSLSRSLRDVRSKTSAELSGFYILDMRSFSGVNDRVAKQSERLTQFLEGDGSTLQKARTLTSIVSDVQGVREEIRQKNAEALALTRDSELISSKTQRTTAELANVESNPLLRELLDIERNLRSESRQFRSESLAHLKRPLRRLRDLSERGDAPLGIDEREALDMYIKTPYRSFLSTKTGHHLNAILEKLGAALRSGKMGFKPRKAARVMSQLEQLISNDELHTRQTHGRSLLARRRKLLQDPDCKNLFESRKQLLRDLDVVKAERDEVQEKQRAAREKLAVLNKRVQDLLAHLELKTREYTGKDVRVEKLQLRPISVS